MLSTPPPQGLCTHSFLPALPTPDICVASSLKAIYTSAEMSIYCGHSVSSFSLLPHALTSTPGTSLFPSMALYDLTYLLSAHLSSSLGTVVEAHWRKDFVLFTAVSSAYNTLLGVWQTFKKLFAEVRGRARPWRTP